MNQGVQTGAIRRLADNVTVFAKKSQVKKSKLKGALVTGMATAFGFTAVKACICGIKSPIS